MKKTIYSFVGDFYHNHDIIFSAVSKAVAMIGEDVALVDCQLSQLQDVLSKNPDVIIMDLENRIDPQDEVIQHWLTEELDDKITAYVENGGRFFAMHAALASYDVTTKYTQMLKGYFLSHPKDNCTVRFTSNENLPFANQEKFDYEVMDEHYFLHCNEESTNVFMYSESENGRSYGGWNHTYGQGKVICIVPTHRKDGFEHEETVRLIHHAFQWCLES